MRARRLRCIKVLVLGVVGTFTTIQILSLFSLHSWSSQSSLGPEKAPKFIDRGLQNFAPPLPPPKEILDAQLLESENQNNKNEESSSPNAVTFTTTNGVELPSKKLVQGRQVVAKSLQLSDSLAGKRFLGGMPKFSNNRNNSTAKSVTSSSEDVTVVEDATLPVGSLSDVAQSIVMANLEQRVRHEDKFGPVNNDTIVIAIQVHNRLQYLKQLISSLSVARGISETLLVFSHDYWDEEINAEVASIDFAKTTQIFYPYSIQTHPNEFPGESPEDCPRDAKKEQNWPDVYGHYREAKFTQTKHHWWWKANRIFDQLEVTKYHTGLVVFLEEDHHVAEDFLHVLKLVDKERRANHKDCDIICLGTYLKNLNFPRNSKMPSQASHHHQVPPHLSSPHLGVGMGAIFRPPHPAMAPPSQMEAENEEDEDALPPTHVAFRGGRMLLGWVPSNIISSVIGAFTQEFRGLWPGGPTYSKKRIDVAVTQWLSARHNMGMAFTRDLWRKVHKCHSFFCAFDDYNWDWSLHHVSLACFERRLRVMLVKAPRIFHVGECGVHHKKKECETSAAKVIKKVEDILTQVKPYLFPQFVVAAAAHTRKGKTPKGNGGWGDRRDVQLCEAIAKPFQDGDEDYILERALEVNPDISRTKMTSKGGGG